MWGGNISLSRNKTNKSQGKMSERIYTIVSLGSLGTLHSLHLCFSNLCLNSLIKRLSACTSEQGYQTGCSGNMSLTQ